MSEPQLNQQQKKAVTHGSGPLLIVAGAGTGKTTVITERIKHLILKENILPENILALTFTEKASSEMQQRIDVALPLGYADMWIHTFHAFCDRILRAESLHIGLTSNYKMMTEAESLLFLRNHLFDLKLSYFRPLGNPDKFLQGLLQHFSRLKDEDISPETYHTFAQKLDTNQEQNPEEKEMTTELASAYQTYEALKVKEGVMDFGDLISNTIHLFRTRKSILQKYQKQFKFILIDEFQDTNYAQNQLALLLAGDKQNITVVGDDDQAIYRWRGASLSNMMQFKSHFPKTTVVSLTQNYRSNQAILDGAYRLIQHNNPDRLEVQEKIDKHLVALEDEKLNEKRIFFLDSKKENIEAETIVEKIKELHKEGYAYKDFAILVRANDHAQPFLRILQRQDIPHQFLGPGKLFHQEEIKDFIAYLKVLYSPEDIQSLYRVLAMSVFTVPAKDISTLLTFSKKQNKHLFEIFADTNSLSLSDEGRVGIEKIHSLFTKHMDMIPKHTAGNILYDFLEHSGLMQKYLTIQTQDDDIKAQNISKFFEKLKQFEFNNENASVYTVVDWIDLSMQLGESPQSAEVDWSDVDAVNLLTVHASKGLEFPIVFIVSAVSQRFPSRERHEQIPIPESLIKEILPIGDYHMQEERRLFYVALTRAKEYVFLSAAQFYGESKRARKISPFIYECLGEEPQQKISDKHAEPTNLKTLYPADAIRNSLPAAKPDITYLSYSQIQTFDVCPLHYKLKYLLHIPTLPSAALSFGTSVHSVLKEFYTRALQGEKVSTKDIPEILESVWISEGYTSEGHVRAAFTGAQTLLENYISKYFSPKQLPIALEYPFQFSIGKLKIGGRMDRVDKLPDGSIEIIDYKTGKPSKKSQAIKGNLQLAIYAMAAKCIPTIGDKLPPITVSLQYVETGEKISTQLTKEDLEKASEKILQKAKEIEESNFSCSKTMLCEDCEYAMLCQAHI